MDSPAPHASRTAQRGNWLFGRDATRGERVLVFAVATAAVALVLSTAHGKLDWHPWQQAIVALLTIDIAGGVSANMLGSAKLQYHGDTHDNRRTVRLLRRSDVFAAAHVQPFVLALAGLGAWTWAALWYAIALAGTIVVTQLPLHLRRPAAGGIVALAIIYGADQTAPPGLTWFGPLMVLKLVLAHAVPEEPYRP